MQMTTKHAHTHRGTCQACGRVQAVDNTTNLVAKHGYTVNWGYFNGTCQGSELRPAEHDTSHTIKTIDWCLKTAESHDSWAAALKSGTQKPTSVERWDPNASRVVRGISSRGAYVAIPFDAATVEEQRTTIKNAIHKNEMQASGLRSHANALTTRVLPRLGQALYAVEELNKKVEKPAAPVVDVKAAKVVGTFPTKAARQDALAKLSRQYDNCRETIQQAYLALPHSARTEAKTEVYYGPYQLNHWRPKHSMLVLNEFPALAEVVVQIEQLVAAREAVKAAP